MTATGKGIARVLTALVLLGGLALLTARPAFAGGDWNDEGVKWRPYDQGLAEAKKAKKPICLIVYTTWCPHCANYSKVFHDPKVVEKTKKFVMIRLDGDKDKDISGKYALDGAYIPRTFFLSSSGVVDQNIHAPRDQYKYFYDEHSPAAVLAAMDEALKQIKN